MKRNHAGTQTRTPAAARPRRRSFILPAYLTLLTLSLVWISFQGGPLPYLTFYTLLVLPVGSAAYLFYVCRALRFYQGPSSHLLTRSEAISFPIVLENTGPLPIVSLRLRMEKDYCTVMNFDDDRVWSLNPGSRLEFEPEIVCLYAGAYLAGATHFVIRDCFGLLSYTGNIPMPWRAVVRPPVTDRADALLDMEPVRNALELHRSSVSEPTLGSELREYQRGDSLRYVHWKNSARSGTLLIRQPEPRQMEQIRILLLPAAIQEDRLARIRRRDHFLELTVSIADYFCRQNQPVTFWYPQEEMREITVDSYENFQPFYEQIPDILAACDKARDSALNSARDSVRDSARNSARDSVRDSVGHSARDSARNTARNSASDSALNSASDSARNTARNSASDSARDSLSGGRTPDWQAWLAVHGGGDTVLLLREEYVDENPLTVYTRTVYTGTE